MGMISEYQASLEAPSKDFDEAALDELVANDQNGHVGLKLLSESERVRVWGIALAPGERLPFHRHVLDYFWTAMNAGRARSRYGDGMVRTFDYTAGEVMHLRFAEGQSMIHDLTNVGDTALSFVTVEFLQSANAPLAL